ncbi:MAG: PKD domain-containing protein [Bacteroidetes bacterium]|nr:MAG: PKD domain-containing protein [Bacteroidota bacterium]
MNLKIPFTILLLILNLYSISQQWNNWYFGARAGITFNSGSPVVITNSFMNASEGCATVSNSAGSILFYTDGIKVWDRTNNFMPNGTNLFGHGSTTHAAIVVPKPRDTNRYYVFTADAADHDFTNGYRYSEVDMTLNGGLGDVTANRNVLLYTPCTEKLAAVRHPNGIDYWVITKEWNNNRYRVYKIDCGGINTTPIISDVGVIHGGTTQPYFGGIGTIKVSPDGRKIAAAITGGPGCGVQILDFNTATGQLSNPVFLTGYFEPALRPYGVEFSPNSSLLYVSSGNNKDVFQYDLSSNNETTINASKYTTITNDFHNAMQLGPDNKIYVTDFFSDHLSVINNPDVYGVGMNFAEAVIALNGRLCFAGLPAIIGNSTAAPLPPIDFTYSFINCYVQFSGTTNGLSGTFRWHWDFGDGVTDTFQTVRHSYRGSGSYNVQLTVYSTSPCGVSDTFRISKPVIINNVFSVDFLNTGNCANQIYQFTDNTVLNTGAITGYSWDFGDGNNSVQQSPAHSYASPGVFTVKFVVSTSGVCRADSIEKTIFVDTRPVVDFSFVGGCKDSAILLTDASSNATGGVAQWTWDFGNGNTSTIQNPTANYSIPGNFNVTLTAISQHGCRGSLIKPISIESAPTADYSFNTVCLGKPVTFTDNSTNSLGNIISWQWNFGDNSGSTLRNPVHSFMQEGDFPVTLIASTQNGCNSISHLETLIVRQAIANAGRDTIAVYNEPIQLNGSGGANYQWSPSAFLNNSNIANPVATLTNDQVFSLNITTAQGCTGTDNVSITVVKTFDIYVPSGFTPNGDGKNELLQPYPLGIREMEYFRIFNRWGQMVFASKNSSDGWNGKLNGINQPVGVYVWIINAIDIAGKRVERKGTSVLIR